MTPCRICQKPTFGPSGLCTEHRAAQQRDSGQRGMTDAVDHAERDHSGWTAIAAGYLDRFAMSHALRDYLAEEIAPWAAEHGCPAPPDQRAWGAIVKDASKRGIIEQTGLAAKNKLSGHASTWRPLWRTVLQGGN